MNFSRWKGVRRKLTIWLSSWVRNTAQSSYASEGLLVLLPLVLVLVLLVLPLLLLLLPLLVLLALLLLALFVEVVSRPMSLSRSFQRLRELLGLSAVGLRETEWAVEDLFLISLDATGKAKEDIAGQAHLLRCCWLTCSGGGVELRANI